MAFSLSSRAREKGGHDGKVTRKIFSLTSVQVCWTLTNSMYEKKRRLGCSRRTFPTFPHAPPCLFHLLLVQHYVCTYEYCRFVHTRNRLFSDSSLDAPTRRKRRKNNWRVVVRKVISSFFLTPPVFLSHNPFAQSKSAAEVLYPITYLTKKTTEFHNGHYHRITIYYGC